MRRSLILSTVLAAIAAVSGACTETKTPENKPVTTPSPVTTVSPVPTASPSNVNGKTEVKPVNGKDPASLGNDANPANNGKIRETKPPIPATPKAK